MPNRFPFNTPNHPEDNRSINKAFDRNYGNRLKSGDTTTLKYTIKDGDGEPLDKERLPNMQTSLILKYEGVTAYKTEFEATLEEVTENYVGDLVARFRIDEALPPSDTPYVVEFHFEDDEDLFIFPSVNTLELYITPSALNSDEEAIKSISDQRLSEIIERKLEENPVLSEVEANELARQENYQELLDTGVMQTKINERLEGLEEEYAPKLTEVTTQLAQTTQELNARVSATIANAGDGTLPTEVVDMRTVNGKTYTVAGDALRAVSKGEGIEDGTITAEKISDFASGPSVNIFDKETAVKGEYYSGALGLPIELGQSPNWHRPEKPVDVKAGDVIRFNTAYMSGYYVGLDDDDICRQIASHRSEPGFSEVTAAEGVTRFWYSVYAPVVDEAMVTVNNPMPSEYVPPKARTTAVIEWLDYKPKSVTLEALSDDVINRFSNNPSVVSDWNGKTFISNGTSISWQDGKAYSGTQDIARGYQTIIKEKLGFSSYLNVGVSGKAMADGTANGSGIVTAGMNRDYTTHALATIEAGTNDFKLNVQLGDIGSIGDENFDRTTFYGAYRTLIEFILNQNPNIRLVLFTPLQRDNGGYNGWDFVNVAGHTLDDYRKAIFSLGEMYGLPVCDLYANSGFNKFTLSAFTMDGLHPNDVGYARMGGYAAQFINDVGL